MLVPFVLFFIMTFIQQGQIHLIKRSSIYSHCYKTVTVFISNKWCSFELYLLKNPKKTDITGINYFSNK